jgi:hypothetical protein|tara:strand:+ start:1968 stop:2453 length:486 start_codon:yes stop_codon:yes gene_type:complete
MSVFVSKELDTYISIYSDSNPIWIATLSNDEVIYQDDGRPDVEPASAWLRMKQYCEENDLHITNMKVRNRSHIEDAGSNYDGYFFCKGAGALMFGDFTVHTFNIGVLENGKLRVRTWRLPELIPERFEERDPYEASPECLIIKKGALDEQRLQASDDRPIV